MNGRKSKMIRRQAPTMAAVFYYKMFPEETKDFSVSQVIDILTPTTYEIVLTGSTNKPDSTSVMLSQTCIRKFIKMLKHREKHYAA